VAQKKIGDDESIRLMLAYLCTATEAGASRVRKVQILDRFDLTDKEIAKVCGCSEQLVRNARFMAKKGKENR
jgi:hypothetical protein